MKEAQINLFDPPMKLIGFSLSESQDPYTLVGEFVKAARDRGWDKHTSDLVMNRALQYKTLTRDVLEAHIWFSRLQDSSFPEQTTAVPKEPYATRRKKNI
jgi:hypothetical protein